MEVKDEDLQLSPQFKKAILEAQKQGTQNKNSLKTQFSKKVELKLFFKQTNLIKDLYVHNPKQKYTILHSFLVDNFKLTDSQADIELLKRCYFDMNLVKPVLGILSLLIICVVFAVIGPSAMIIFALILTGIFLIVFVLN